MNNDNFIESFYAKQSQKGHPIHYFFNEFFKLLEAHIVSGDRSQAANSHSQSQTSSDSEIVIAKNYLQPKTAEECNKFVLDSVEFFKWYLGSQPTKEQWMNVAYFFQALNRQFSFNIPTADRKRNFYQIPEATQKLEESDDYDDINLDMPDGSNQSDSICRNNKDILPNIILHLFAWVQQTFKKDLEKIATNFLKIFSSFFKLEENRGDSSSDLWQHEFALQSFLIINVLKFEINNNIESYHDISNYHLSYEKESCTLYLVLKNLNIKEQLWIFFLLMFGGNDAKQLVSSVLEKSSIPLSFSEEIYKFLNFKSSFVSLFQWLNSYYSEFNYVTDEAIMEELTAIQSTSRSWIKAQMLSHLLYFFDNLNDEKVISLFNNHWDFFIELLNDFICTNKYVRFFDESIKRNLQATMQRYFWSLSEKTQKMVLQAIRYGHSSLGVSPLPDQGVYLTDVLFKADCPISVDAIRRGVEKSKSLSGLFYYWIDEREMTGVFNIFTALLNIDSKVIRSVLSQTMSLYYKIVVSDEYLQSFTEFLKNYNDHSLSVASRLEKEAFQSRYIFIVLKSVLSSSLSVDKKSGIILKIIREFYDGQDLLSVFSELYLYIKKESEEQEDYYHLFECALSQLVPSVGKNLQFLMVKNTSKIPHFPSMGENSRCYTVNTSSTFRGETDVISALLKAFSDYPRKIGDSYRLLLQCWSRMIAQVFVSVFSFDKKKVPDLIKAVKTKNEALGNLVNALEYFYVSLMASFYLLSQKNADAVGMVDVCYDQLISLNSFSNFSNSDLFKRVNDIFQKLDLFDSVSFDETSQSFESKILSLEGVCVYLASRSFQDPLRFSSTALGSRVDSLSPEGRTNEVKKQARSLLTKVASVSSVSENLNRRTVAAIGCYLSALMSPALSTDSELSSICSILFVFFHNMTVLEKEDIDKLKINEQFFLLCGAIANERAESDRVSTHEEKAQNGLIRLTSCIANTEEAALSNFSKHERKTVVYRMLCLWLYQVKAQSSCLESLLSTLPFDREPEDRAFLRQVLTDLKLQEKDIVYVSNPSGFSCLLSWFCQERPQTPENVVLLDEVPRYGSLSI